MVLRSRWPASAPAIQDTPGVSAGTTLWNSSARGARTTKRPADRGAESGDTENRPLGANTHLCPNCRNTGPSQGASGVETVEKGALPLLHLTTCSPPHCSQEVLLRVQNAHLAPFGQNTSSAVGGGGVLGTFSVAAGIGS